MKDHKKAVTLIIQKEFGVSPKTITRMTTGIVNEVYLVSLEDRDVVVRLHQADKTLRGSEKHIPLYRSKGIKVPEILASDYSKTSIPFYYQILSKIDGKDIGLVIADLSRQQLKVIAKEIASIFKKLHSIPTNGKFGYVYAEEMDLESSWTAEMQDRVKTIKERGTKTGVTDEHLLSDLDTVMDEYSAYFDSVPSEYYYDDICSKNIMIHEGVFQGLVDVDGAMHGDYLEAVGRIKASWYGTSYGEFYSDAVMNALGLDSSQRKVVTMYAFMNSLYWLCEIGIKFNENTSTEIDWKAVEWNKERINSILSELKKTE